MSEIVVQFGTDSNLVGTFSSPSQPASSSVVFLLINAGVLPRMGPHRFNVKLARELADKGFASLRFDLSGQGDSRPSSLALAYEEQVDADLRQAMDHVMATTGIRQFVVAGICSGAYAGFSIAHQDPRVVGLWMMDGYAYVTRKSTIVRAWRQLQAQFGKTLASWLSKLAQVIKQRIRPEPERSAEAPAESNDNMGPTRDEFAALLQDITNRGVKTYMMYTSDVMWRYSYAGQFRDTFRGHPFVDEVRCDHMPEVDHTITTLASQLEVIRRIIGWAQGAFR